jgi:hypothetical protein
MMKLRIVACAQVAAGLFPLAAMAQPQEFLIVPRLANFGYPGTTSVMLFNPHDGSLVDPAFIRSAGAEYVLYYMSTAIQVDGEIWMSDQLEHVIFRFDLLGNYLGAISGNINNTRGMAFHDGVVYVTNGSAAGSTPASSLARFDAAGNYLGAFSVGSFPWDVIFYSPPAPHQAGLLVSHSGTVGISRWGLDGTPLGMFHVGDIRSASQLTLKSNGNVLAAGNANVSPPAPPVVGLYEFDPSGAQVNYINVAAPRGVQELGNGNLLYANSSGVHIYDVNTASSTQVIAAPASMYINRIAFDLSATGACCLPGGSCQVMAMSACRTQDGSFRGAGTSCAGAACPQPGACCLPGGCSLRQPQACADLEGVWYGAGSTCESGTCLQVLHSPNQSTTTLINTHGAGFFLDLTATEDLVVQRIDYYPRHHFGAEVTVDIYTREGTHVGYISDPTGWTLTQTLHAASTTGVASDSYGSPGIQNATRLMLTNPIAVPAGQTVGVYLVGTVGGVRMRGSGSVFNFSNDHLSVFANTVRDGPPFAGTVRTPRGFPGHIYYQLGGIVQPCYANCDGSTTPPILNVEDFTCFINEFAAASQLPHEQQLTHYANCDQSTTPPVLNVEDFTCFINQFAQGCP